MHYNLSYWEKQTFVKEADVAIIGGGIVGVNAAISIKQAEPDKDVVIIDRGFFPLGASTRNAGFACFGSITELLDDLKDTEATKVYELLSERLAGLEFLRTRVGDQNLAYKACGGYEVFDTAEDFNANQIRISELNTRIFNVTGLEETFLIRQSKFAFRNFHSSLIYNQYEGALDPGKMMWNLLDQAANLGVRVYNNVQVHAIDLIENGVAIRTSSLELQSKKLIVCTNGFTKSISFKGLDGIGFKRNLDENIIPARNQVLLTEPLSQCPLDSCFHYDKGYVYFRNIDNRVLIGGGRNMDRNVEETEKFGRTEKIKAYLLDILVEKIGLRADVNIDHEWSGIMGIGPVKSPILRKHSEHIIFAVRLGGMGVALGSLLGHKAAKLLLNSNEKKEKIRS